MQGSRWQLLPQLNLADATKTLPFLGDSNGSPNDLRSKQLNHVSLEGIIWAHKKTKFVSHVDEEQAI
jgi:hypothetical protein